ncbi:MAG: DUF6152 family protein [Pseudomonadota bacterium]
MKIIARISILIFALAGVAVPVLAHHSWPVNMNTLVTVQGTVTGFMWENPHPMISLTVSTPDGETEEWQIGGPALNRMEAKGWTKTTVKPGDVITGVGYQFNDGQKIIRLEKVTFADGKEFSVYGR